MLQGQNLTLCYPRYKLDVSYKLDVIVALNCENQVQVNKAAENNF